MEQQLRDLQSSMQNLDLVPVNNTGASDLLRVLASHLRQTLRLQDRHSPSTASLESLEQITLDQLEDGRRNDSKVVHLKVAEVEKQYGLVVTGTDCNGVEGKIWTILPRPFGREIVRGMTIAIKEPYLGRGPNALKMVCVHHPTDCTLVPECGDDKTSVSSVPSSLPTTRCGPIDIRSSRLGGRGFFAKQEIEAGDLLLCEKPLGICNSLDASAYGHGIDDIMPGELTNPRKLSLLQQLVENTLGNRVLLDKLFALHAGTEAGTIAGGVFDIYRAASIIKHNAHIIFPGSASTHHDRINLDVSKKPNMSPSDQLPGIWLHASMFNHSCLPNTTWSWVNDLFIVRANRTIEPDEELTISYVPNSYDPVKRRRVLKMANTFSCSCLLCIADCEHPRSLDAQDSLTKSQRLMHSALSPEDRMPIPIAEALMRSALTCYPFKTYPSLPRIQLAEPFYQLGHLHLGPVPTWSAASADQKSSARIYFTFCLELGLGYEVCPHSGKITTGKITTNNHPQPKPVGVVALMALAELAFLGGNMKECAAFKKEAKKFYGIWYGETASFEKQHKYFKCSEEGACEQLKEAEVSGKKAVVEGYEALQRKIDAGAGYYENSDYEMGWARRMPEGTAPYWWE